MSLISLNNGTQSTGRFTSLFKESITIPKESRIALLNASLGLDDRLILVTTTNNKFSYLPASGSDVDLIQVTLSPNVYNIKEFLKEITKQMNTDLLYDDSDASKSNRGFQCKATISDSNKLNISTAMTGSQSPKLWTPNFSENFTKTGNDYAKNGDVDKWDAGSVSTRYFNNGCGVLTTSIADITYYFCLGLVKSNLMSDFSDFGPDSYDFAIYNGHKNNDNTQPFVYFIKTTDSSGTTSIEETDTECVNDDIVGFMLSLGALNFYALPSGTDIKYENVVLNNYSLHTESWEYDVSYYGMFSAFTNGANFVAPAMHYDPYHKVTAEMVKYPHFKEGNQYELDPDEEFLGLGASVMTLILADPVQKLFGFTSEPLPSPNALMHTFKAQKTLPEASLPSNIRVIVENMRLDSYNSRTGKRESILMTIPTVLFEDFKVSFERQNPIYIKMNNKEQFVLNNITLRIEDFAGNILPIKPSLSDITILID